VAGDKLGMKRGKVLLAAVSKFKLVGGEKHRTGLKSAIMGRGKAED